ncbi:hypothetical protein CC78DRAFT_5811 [Lojkania enalia]|uniref:Uncharacterized protein n=1 Tax=Lojkania enalia TaxID=147567 RepID=A0A9P4NCV6_9PLEO|nr:hypothetical protein CC78DRAFT_5811 [Didymosphaeria enalia]
MACRSLRGLVVAGGCRQTSGNGRWCRSGRSGEKRREGQTKGCVMGRSPVYRATRLAGTRARQISHSAARMARLWCLAGLSIWPLLSYSCTARGGSWIAGWRVTGVLRGALAGSSMRAPQHSQCSEQRADSTSTADGEGR